MDRRVGLRSYLCLLCIFGTVFTIESGSVIGQDPVRAQDVKGFDFEYALYSTIPTESTVHGLSASQYHMFALMRQYDHRQLQDSAFWRLDPLQSAWVEKVGDVGESLSEASWIAVASDSEDPWMLTMTPEAVRYFHMESLEITEAVNVDVDKFRAGRSDWELVDRSLYVLGVDEATTCLMEYDVSGGEFKFVKKHDLFNQAGGKQYDHIGAGGVCKCGNKWYVANPGLLVIGVYQNNSQGYLVKSTDIPVMESPDILACVGELVYVARAGGNEVSVYGPNGLAVFDTEESLDLTPDEFPETVDSGKVDPARAAVGLPNVWIEPGDLKLLDLGDLTDKHERNSQGGIDQRVVVEVTLHHKIPNPYGGLRVLLRVFGEWDNAAGQRNVEVAVDLPASPLEGSTTQTVNFTLPALQTSYVDRAIKCSAAVTILRGEGEDLTWLHLANNVAYTRFEVHPRVTAVVGRYCCHFMSGVELNNTYFALTTGNRPGWEVHFYLNGRALAPDREPKSPQTQPVIIYDPYFPTGRPSLQSLFNFKSESQYPYKYYRTIQLSDLDPERENILKVVMFDEHGFMVSDPFNHHINLVKKPAFLKSKPELSYLPAPSGAHNPYPGLRQIVRYTYQTSLFRNNTLFEQVNITTLAGIMNGPWGAGLGGSMVYVLDSSGTQTINGNAEFLAQIASAQRVEIQGEIFGNASIVGGRSIVDRLAASANGGWRQRLVQPINAGKRLQISLELGCTLRGQVDFQQTHDEYNDIGYKTKEKMGLAFEKGLIQIGSDLTGVAGVQFGTTKVYRIGAMMTVQPYLDMVFPAPPGGRHLNSTGFHFFLEVDTSELFFHQRVKLGPWTLKWSQKDELEEDKQGTGRRLLQLQSFQTHDIQEEVLFSQMHTPDQFEQSFVAGTSKIKLFSDGSHCVAGSCIRSGLARRSGRRLFASSDGEVPEQHFLSMETVVENMFPSPPSMVIHPLSGQGLMVWTNLTRNAGHTSFSIVASVLDDAEDGDKSWSSPFLLPLRKPQNISNSWPERNLDMQPTASKMSSTVLGEYMAIAWTRLRNGTTTGNQRDVLASAEIAFAILHLGEDGNFEEAAPTFVTENDVPDGFPSIYCDGYLCLLTWVRTMDIRTGETRLFARVYDALSERWSSEVQLTSAVELLSNTVSVSLKGTYTDQSASYVAAVSFVTAANCTSVEHGYDCSRAYVIALGGEAPSFSQYPIQVSVDGPVPVGRDLPPPSFVGVWPQETSCTVHVRDDNSCVLAYVQASRVYYRVYDLAHVVSDPSESVGRLGDWEGEDRVLLSPLHGEVVTNEVKLVGDDLTRAVIFVAFQQLGDSDYPDQDAFRQLVYGVLKPDDNEARAFNLVAELQSSHEHSLRVGSLLLPEKLKSTVQVSNMVAGVFRGTLHVASVSRGSVKTSQPVSLLTAQDTRQFSLRTEQPVLNVGVANLEHFSVRMDPWLRWDIQLPSMFAFPSRPVYPRDQSYRVKGTVQNTGVLDAGQSRLSLHFGDGEGSLHTNLAHINVPALAPTESSAIDTKFDIKADQRGGYLYAIYRKADTAGGVVKSTTKIIPSVVRLSDLKIGLPGNIPLSFVDFEDTAETLFGRSFLRHNVVCPPAPAKSKTRVQAVSEGQFTFSSPICKAALFQGIIAPQGGMVGVKCAKVNMTALSFTKVTKNDVTVVPAEKKDSSRVFLVSAPHPDDHFLHDNHKVEVRVNIENNGWWDDRRVPVHLQSRGASGRPWSVIASTRVHIRQFQERTAIFYVDESAFEGSQLRAVLELDGIQTAEAAAASRLVSPTLVVKHKPDIKIVSNSMIVDRAFDDGVRVRVSLKNDAVVSAQNVGLCLRAIPIRQAADTTLSHYGQGVWDPDTVENIKSEANWFGSGRGRACAAREHGITVGPLSTQEVRISTKPIHNKLTGRHLLIMEVILGDKAVFFAEEPIYLTPSAYMSLTVEGDPILERPAWAYPSGSEDVDSSIATMNKRELHDGETIIADSTEPWAPMGSSIDQSPSSAEVAGSQKWQIDFRVFNTGDRHIRMLKVTVFDRAVNTTVGSKIVTMLAPDSELVVPISITRRPQHPWQYLSSDPGDLLEQLVVYTESASSAHTQTFLLSNSPALLRGTRYLIIMGAVFFLLVLSVGARCLVAREHKKRVAGPLLGCSVQDAAINGYYEPIPKDEQQDWRMRSESYSNAVDL